jgi:hypothetical protein
VAPPGKSDLDVTGASPWAVIVVFAAYCVAANVAIAAFPVAQWTMAQSAGFLSVQKSLSIGSLADSVHRGSTLPNWAPAGQVFADKQLLGPLPFDRQRHEGRSRPTDRALHLDAGRATVCVHPYHWVHL